MTRLKVAVIGAGYVGGLHLVRLLRNPQVAVTGLVEADPRRRVAAAAEFDVASFSNVDALLNHATADAAIICVPPHRRDGMERWLADQGVALMIEKPLALTLCEGESIAAGLNRASQPIAVGYQWRHLTGLPTVVEFLSGRTPQLALGHWLSSTPPVNWWGRTDTAGSQFTEQATHLIDLALHLLGPVVAVTATASAARLNDSDTGFVKAATASLTFASGCVGSFVSSCVAPDGFRRSLELVVDGAAVTITERGCTIQSDTGTTDLANERPDLYEREQHAFLDLVRLGHSPGAARLAGVADALAALRVTDAIGMSIAEGRPVAITVAGEGH